METLTLEPMRAETAVHADAPKIGRSPLLPAFALAEHLDALAGLIHGVSDAHYLASPADGATGSIALHVRQAVDDVLALLDRPSGQPMTYDGGSSEHDRRQAIALLRGLAFRVRDMAPRTADVPIVVDTPLDRLGARTRIRSSLGRELIFVLRQVSAAERVTEARCAS